MSLPKSADLSTLDYDYEGVPFAQVQTKGSIDTTTLDYDYNGVPFTSAQSTVSYTQNLSYTQPSSYSFTYSIIYSKILSYIQSLASTLSNMVDKLLAYSQVSVYSFNIGGQFRQTLNYAQTISYSLDNTISIFKSLVQSSNLVLNKLVATAKSFVSNTSESILVGIVNSLALSYALSSALSYINKTIKILDYAQSFTNRLQRAVYVTKSYVQNTIESLFKFISTSIYFSTNTTLSIIYGFLHVVSLSYSISSSLVLGMNFIWSLVQEYSQSFIYNLTFSINRLLKLLYTQPVILISSSIHSVVFSYISTSSLSLLKQASITLSSSFSNIYILGQSMVKPITIQFTKFYQKGTSRATKLLGTVRIRMLGQGRNRETKE